MSSKIITVGLTGGIGSGKTKVAAFFKAYGAVVLYADQIARELVDNDQKIKRGIITRFGRESYRADGKLDRPRMAAIIFRDLRSKKALDAIVHPSTIRLIEKFIKILRMGGYSGLVIVEAALIFESGLADKFDYIIVVDTPADIRVRRLMQRDNASENEIRTRIRSQLSNQVKAAKADIVIKNDGSLGDLRERTQFVYDLLMCFS